MNMKRTLVASVVAGVASATTMLLKDEERREKAKRQLKQMYTKVTKQRAENQNGQTEIKAGHPDPYDVDDNKMVNEGALYSVQRYNEKQQQNQY
ncbi:hypothetical protein BpOF4_02295 [Alkalihalophilus pseudofirmus OF4]|uniref:Uncharacterized protein n=2 Tax=Alkalihalophilus pseudofirmus TaxID=79885 RepID=D3FVL1_ALKPO|nr:MULTISPECIES: hypothetical protein [Alkalihalophilus]ADC48526.1 hypothetical protein BpOF4_02295 [Alkalihalophilus pseudofirmus OF4]MDV2885705.1 hypothetical protein [Alkalihalophilus pseudofirmus]MED1600978.1 hypothetical protein [Alkalihalophilus marmarensis]WEG16008.1 hypothetical protein PQ478_16040 [Alkalihalophilus pseudofirmus]